MERVGVQASANNAKEIKMKEAILSNAYSIWLTVSIFVVPYVIRSDVVCAAVVFLSGAGVLWFLVDNGVDRYTLYLPAYVGALFFAASVAAVFCKRFKQYRRDRTKS
jgi:hypothetical protein